MSVPSCPATRPVLAPALARLWRGEQLQLGASPADAVLLDGADARLLRLLDGTRTRAQLEAADPRAAPLLDALEAAGLLLDADDLTPPGVDRDERERLGPDVASLSLVHGRGAARALLARRSARVVVHGAGRVGGPLAAQLAAAGVGTVDLRDDRRSRLADAAVGGVTPADVGRPRADAVASRLPSAGAVRPPALVVLADSADGADAEVADTLRRLGTPHLVVRVDERTGVVGPLVLPGRSSCLRCQGLTRTALDPGWPAVAAQLDGGRRGAACDTVLAAAVASQAALQVLELLEGGDPASVDGTLELTIPGWRWQRRSWPRHPGCPCSAVGQRAA